MLCLGSQASGQDTRNTPALFLERQRQALVAGGYQKARPYSVEAVLFYSSCRYRQNKDPDPDAWMIVGISARLAMRMGYHRDPRHLSGISPFEGEMRRRTFYMIEMFEIVLSFQAGLPAILHEEECDVDPPGNLADTDFDEDCKVMPASRPLTDITLMSYWICKGRQTKILRRIIRHTSSFAPQTFERTMELDRELQEAHRNIAPWLRIKPIASSFMDQPYEVMYRLNMEILHLKSLCFLHREYLSQQVSEPTFDRSRKTCIDAALQILTYQAELHEACRPGGRFHNESWVLGSLTIHDFLLAATIACVSLYESHNKPPAAATEADLMAQKRKYDVLRMSRDIWCEWRDVSKDARRAAAVLSRMLVKVPRPNASTTTTAQCTKQSPGELAQSSTSEDRLHGAQEQSSSEDSCWNTSALETPAQQFPTDRFNPFDASVPDPLETMFGESDGVDWVRVHLPIGLSSADKDLHRVSSINF